MHRRATLLFVLTSALMAYAAAPSYHLLKKVAVGGEGGWDYLVFDPSSHRLFVSRGTHVQVLDGNTGALLGDLPGTTGVHGIALASSLGRGFTSNGRANTVTVFDLTTLKPAGQLATGENPDAILYDSASGRVFTFNGGSHNSTAIEADSAKVAGTIPLSGKPEFAVADGKGRIFVNIEDKHSISVIDSRKLAVTSTWDIPGCEEPTGLALDRKNRRLFAGCRNKVMAILDAGSGKLITTVPIGAGVDATAFDPGTGLAFSSNGEGTLSVVHENSPSQFELVQTVPTEPGARTMALDESTGNIYLVTARFGERPAATPENPHPRPAVVPGSFTLLIFGRK